MPHISFNSEQFVIFYMSQCIFVHICLQLRYKDYRTERLKNYTNDPELCNSTIMFLTHTVVHQILSQTHTHSVEDMRQRCHSVTHIRPFPCNHCNQCRNNSMIRDEFGGGIYEPIRGAGWSLIYGLQS